MCSRDYPRDDGNMTISFKFNHLPTRLSQRTLLAKLSNSYSRTRWVSNIFLLANYQPIFGSVLTIDLRAAQPSRVYELNGDSGCQSGTPWDAGIPLPAAHRTEGEDEWTVGRLRWSSHLLRGSAAWEGHKPSWLAEFKELSSPASWNLVMDYRRNVVFL